MEEHLLPTESHGAMGWHSAALCIFAFAMPGGVTGMGYAIGAQGFILGGILTVIFTVASLVGAYLLLRICLDAETTPRSIEEIGRISVGPLGGRIGASIQMGNMVLFMPIAMTFCAESLQDIFPSLFDCGDYYIFLVAGICLATTQIRTLANTTIPSLITAFFVLIIALIQVLVVANNPNPAKREMQYFGNGEEEIGHRIVRGSLGASIPIWSYVPALILTELLGDMHRPVELMKSFQVSAVASMVLFILVGSYIGARWGFDQTNPVMITTAWGAASHRHAAVEKDLLNVLLLVSRFQVDKLI
jgi:amino acid permease